MNRQSPSLWRMLREREFCLLLLIAATTLLVSVIDAGFLRLDNLRDILVRSAPTAIVACGVMLVVVTGEIDISVGSLMAFLAALLGVTTSANEWAWHASVGISLVLVIGTAIGFVTGTLVTIGKVPSIIVTLGLLTALRGITTLMMRGGNIAGLPPTLQSLTKEGTFGIPLSIWIAVATVVATAIIISATPLGRRLFALGSSSHSAHLAGLNETRLKLFVYAYTGFLTAVATIVDVPRLPKIEAGIGVGFELLVVTCVVVGGVSIAGGRGKLAGVLLAVLLMTMVRPVLTFMDIGEAGEKWTRAIQGLFILLAVVVDSVVSRQTRGATTR